MKAIALRAMRLLPAGYASARRFSAEPIGSVDEVMTFRPAHSLQAHRPLGGVMRARLQVYRALSDFRHRQNGVRAEDTAWIEDVPA